jgi:hypothetical protein
MTPGSSRAAGDGPRNALARPLAPTHRGVREKRTAPYATKAIHLSRERQVETENIYAGLERSLSLSRLSSYRDVGLKVEQVLARYFWNMELSAALHESLHLLEVAIRNELNLRVQMFYTSHKVFAGSGLCWFEDDRLNAYPELNKLRASMEELESRGVTHPDMDQQVASMSLGFWTGLFAKRYEASPPNYVGLWPHLWRGGRFFVGCPGRFRSRSHFVSLLEPLRELRNRIAHYEPIFQRPTVLQEYRDIRTLLGWIDPLLVEQLDAICEFEQVYHRGAASCRWMRARAVTPEAP